MFAALLSVVTVVPVLIANVLVVLRWVYGAPARAASAFLQRRYDLRSMFLNNLKKIVLSTQGPLDLS